MYEGAGPAYADTAALASDCDLVVRGTGGRLVAREPDGGGNLINGEEDLAAAKPVVIYRFDVYEVLAGELDCGRLNLAYLDSAAMASSVEPIRTGDALVIFILRMRLSKA